MNLLSSPALVSSAQNAHMIDTDSLRRKVVADKVRLATCLSLWWGVTQCDTVREVFFLVWITPPTLSALTIGFITI